eukprot:scaffold13320_cov118-Isochrysis_galbana.AAC.1
MSVWASANARADTKSPHRAARAIGRSAGEAVAPPETTQSSSSRSSSGAGRAHAATRSIRLELRSIAGAVAPTAMPSHASLKRVNKGPPLDRVAPVSPISERDMSAWTNRPPVQSSASACAARPYCAARLRCASLAFRGVTRRRMPSALVSKHASSAIISKQTRSYCSLQDRCSDS